MENKPATNEIKRLIDAFGHASEGLKMTYNHPAFRIELIVTAIMAPLALFLTPLPVERALLIGSMMLVLIVELLNTGIESAIDRISIEWHPLSKRAKDVGSSAVFLSIVNAAIIWLIVLFS